MIPFANNKQKLYLLKRHCFYKDQSNSSEDPSVQFSSVAQSCLTLSNPMDCSTPVLSITNYQSLLKLMSIESVMGSNHLTLCHPLLLLSVFPSIRVFSNESFLCIRWPKY